MQASPGAVGLGGDRGAPPERATQPAQLLLEPFAKVLDQVEPVSDLNSLRSTIPGTLGEETVPVAADDLHLRVLPQPPGRAGGGAIGQHIHNRPSLQIHHDGPVALALAPGPIIDPDHTERSVALPRCSSLQTAEDGVVADRHAEAGEDPLGRPPARVVAKKSNEVRQAPGPPAPRHGSAGQRFGEDAPGAPAVPAPQPGNRELDSDADALQWEVLQVPQVGAVAGVGRSAAGWAGSTARPGCGDRPLRRHPFDAEDPNAGEPPNSVFCLMALACADRNRGQPNCEHRK